MEGDAKIAQTSLNHYQEKLSVQQMNVFSLLLSLTKMVNVKHVNKALCKTKINENALLKRLTQVLLAMVKEKFWIKMVLAEIVCHTLEHKMVILFVILIDALATLLFHILVLVPHARITNHHQLIKDIVLEKSLNVKKEKR